MAFYKCGHSRHAVFLDRNIVSYSAYLEWKESTGFEGDKFFKHKPWYDNGKEIREQCRAKGCDCKGYIPMDKSDHRHIWFLNLII